jgi:hypothetical protein
MSWFIGNVREILHGPVDESARSTLAHLSN